MDEREAAVVLVLTPGVGPAAARALRETFGSYRGAVAAALAGRVSSARCGRAIRETVERGAAEAEMRLLRDTGARFVVEGDDDYPGVLAGIARPPTGLYVAGAGLSELQPALAVVGTRTPTPRGAAVARDLAGDVAAAGLTVVSGLARGIDTAAHEGALEACGTTVAVLGTGLLSIYPAENEPLADRIRERGALVSELPLRQAPRAGSFPARNRIIAGLSAGVLVVEGEERSGALITAARALEEGREVFAVPGPITEPQSRGPNALLKSGAVLVECVEDVLSELERSWGPFSRATKRSGGSDDPNGDPSSTRDAADATELVRAALSLTPVSIDELAVATGVSAGRLASVLFDLELSGAARRIPGGLYVASNSPVGAGRRAARA